MWYETFVVELGTKEIFVDVYGAKGKEPTFKVEAGTDWEGFPVPLSKAEQDAAVSWWLRTYGPSYQLDHAMVEQVRKNYGI
jgi:hypothetical protein